MRNDVATANHESSPTRKNPPREFSQRLNGSTGTVLPRPACRASRVASRDLAISCSRNDAAVRFRRRAYRRANKENSHDESSRFGGCSEERAPRVSVSLSVFSTFSFAGSFLSPPVNHRLAPTIEFTIPSRFLEQRGGARGRGEEREREREELQHVGVRTCVYACSIFLDPLSV